MTKAELAEQVGTRVGLRQKETEGVVNVILDSIVDALGNGDKVELRGFGSFRVRHRAAREGRNPKTGENVPVPPKKVPFFKTGKDLREMVDKKQNRVTK